MWSGNHIGHRSSISDNSFITSHVVISGYCNIGQNCFIGVNATLTDNVEIPHDTVVAAGALILKSFNEKGKIYVGSPAKPLDKTAYNHFDIEEYPNEMD